MEETVLNPRRVAAEGVGTGFLVLAVVGSGIMAESLSAGNAALALLANTAATGAALFVLITLLGPVSGASFNPVVSLLSARPGSGRLAAADIGAQLAGGAAGAVAANVMFGRPVLELASKVRTGTGQWAGEFIATFGLLLTIRLVARYEPAKAAAAVALYISSAYWFTASTSFANPAVTLARTLSDSFAGIRPADAPVFILMQAAGGFAGWRLAGWLSEPRQGTSRNS